MSFAMLRNLEESKFNEFQNELPRGKAPLALQEPSLVNREISNIVQTLCSPCSSL
jgi:hypothetical protein